MPDKGGTSRAWEAGILRYDLQKVDVGDLSIASGLRRHGGRRELVAGRERDLSAWIEALAGQNIPLERDSTELFELFGEDSLLAAAATWAAPVAGTACLVVPVTRAQITGGGKNLRPRKK